MARKNRLLFFLSVILLAIGSFIYLFFRPHSILIFSWFKKLGIEKFFKIVPINDKNFIIKFCIYSLPNGLWFISASLLLGIIWANNYEYYIFLTVFFIGNIVIEIFQYFLIVPGTYDFIDIITLIISYSIGLIIDFFAYRS